MTVVGSKVGVGLADGADSGGDVGITVDWLLDEGALLGSADGNADGVSVGTENVGTSDDAAAVGSTVGN